MSLATPVTGFPCPRCATQLAASPAQQGRARCSTCQWTGEAYLFFRLPRQIQTAAAALPEEATCLHHPRKKATAICAGTGDYICSLCAVEMDGQTYSAAYLDSAGKKKAAKAFDRHLPRPDSQIRLYLLLIFIPYINAAAVAFAFLWLPHAFVLYRRALQQRRDDPIFARLMGRSSVIVLPILLGLYALGWLALVITIFYLVEQHRR